MVNINFKILFFIVSTFFCLLPGHSLAESQNYDIAQSKQIETSNSLPSAQQAQDVSSPIASSSSPDLSNLSHEELSSIAERKKLSELSEEELMRIAGQQKEPNGQNSKLAEFRKKYPQYNDMSDQQLADAIHTKYYSDIPLDEFYKKLEFQPQTVQKRQPVDLFKEMGIDPHAEPKQKSHNLLKEQEVDVGVPKKSKANDTILRDLETYERMANKAPEKVKAEKEEEHTLLLVVYNFILGLALVAIVGFISFLSIKIFKGIRDKYGSRSLTLEIPSKEKNNHIYSPSLQNPTFFLTRITQTLYPCIKMLFGIIGQARGFKRLLLAISILWILSVIIYSVFNYLDIVHFLETILFANMPVWLNWFAYWIFTGFKQPNRSLKVQVWSIIILFILLVTVFSNGGFGILFALAGLPLWLGWLIYWVYLGFKKEKS